MLYLKEVYSDPESIIHGIIWNNKDITIEGKSNFWKTWKNGGIVFVQDILDSDNKILYLTDLNKKYGTPMDIMKHNSLVSAIVYGKRINLKYSTIKYNSDILIDFENILFLSLDDIYIPFQSGKSKLFYNEITQYLSEKTN